VMLIAATIAIGGFMFANYVMPVTNLKMRSLLYDIQQQRPELTIKPGVFDNTLEGYSIRIGSRDSKTSLLQDILIFDHTKKQGNVRVTVADSGYMKMSADEKHLLLTLYNGHTYEEMQKGKKDKKHIKSYPHQREHFEHQDLIIEMTGFGLNRSDENLFRNAFSMLNIDQLHHFEDSLIADMDTILNDFHRTMETTLVDKPKTMLIKRSRILPDSVKAAMDRDTMVVEGLHVDTLFGKLSKLEQRRAITQAITYARSNKSITKSTVGTNEWKVSKLLRYQIEIQRKYTLSLLCLIFFFIGAPLGAIIRKGGLGIPVIASVLMFLVYYVISMTGEKFVRENILSPFAGMWISTFILVPISILLTYKAANDSVIMNVETYFLWVKNLLKRAQKRQQR
jgi:lipopolysaccharide export system permease protein